MSQINRIRATIARIRDAETDSLHRVSGASADEIRIALQGSSLASMLIGLATFATAWVAVRRAAT